MSVITAGEYLYTSEEEEINIRKARQFFYIASVYLKSIHDNNQYVPSISMQDIMVDSDDPSKIFFKDPVESTNIKYLKGLQEKNIYDLSAMAFAAHLPRYNTKKDNGLNHNVIRANFYNFSYIFDEKDIPYYESIFRERNFTYYSDYINSLQTSSSKANSNNKQLIYSTLVGKMVSNDDSGFAGILLLVILITVILIIGILIFIFLR